MNLPTVDPEEPFTVAPCFHFTLTSAGVVCPNRAFTEGTLMAGRSVVQKPLLPGDLTKKHPFDIGSLPALVLPMVAPMPSHLLA